MASGRAWRWSPLAVLILVQIGYPLVHGRGRASLVIATVLLGFAISVGHAVATRGVRVGLVLVGLTCGGGLGIEALGVATGFPFGGYGYGSALGPRLLGVPLVIPLAWTWMAWPAWLAAGRLGAGRFAVGRFAAGRYRIGLTRIALAGIALAGWDLFLDPQMVAEGYWHWRHPVPALPGVPGVPLSNYLGWLATALVMMALLALATGRSAGRRAEVRVPAADAPMHALYLWTYLSSVLGLGVFLHLPAAALWGGLGMGVVAIPLAVRLVSRAPRSVAALGLANRSADGALR